MSCRDDDAGQIRARQAIVWGQTVLSPEAPMPLAGNGFNPMPGGLIQFQKMQIDAHPQLLPWTYQQLDKIILVVHEIVGRGERILSYRG